MTSCDAVRSALLTDELEPSRMAPGLAAHLTTCTACRGVHALVHDATRALADTLDREQPIDSPDVILRRIPTDHASALSNVDAGSRWRARLRVAAAFAIVAIGGGLGLTATIIPIVRRFGDPGQELPIATFQLSCLSAEQALDLARGYVAIPGGGVWIVGHGVHAITLRTSASSLNSFRATLHSVDGEPLGACAQPTPPP